jgi:hypothetical protein
VAKNTSQKKMLYAWHFALLRFAITQEREDKLVVFAVAAEVDRTSSRSSQQTHFHFFYRASVEVCDAIENPKLARSLSILKQHLTRIDDQRLQCAFAAAIDLDISDVEPKTVARNARTDLWRGLRG